jgi:hypothetical protein
MTQLEDVRKRLTDQILDEGVLRIWSHNVDSVNHQGEPWAYTVGRTMFGRPELLVTGLGEAVSHNVLAELQDRDVHPDFPVTTSVGQVAFILAEPGLLHAAYAVFGRDFSALQVIHQGQPQPLHPVGGLILTDPYGDGLPEVPC